MNGGGPIWAIFDADAVAREKWQVKPPYVDPDGYFFSADTIEELATKIVNEYQWRPMPPARVERDRRALQFLRRYGRRRRFQEAAAAAQDRQAAVLRGLAHAGAARFLHRHPDQHHRRRCSTCTASPSRVSMPAAIPPAVSASTASAARRPLAASAAGTRPSFERGGSGGLGAERRRDLLGGIWRRNPPAESPRPRDLMGFARAQPILQESALRALSTLTMLAERHAV